MTTSTTPSIAHGGPVPPSAVGGDPFVWYENWVRKIPDAPAVEDGPHVWTYRQLDDAANRVVAQLSGRVGPGDLVAVCLDRSFALVAVAVATARLGAAYLPLGPRPGEQRLADLTGELRIPAIVGTVATLPGDGRPMALDVPALGANVDAPPMVEVCNPAADSTPAPPGTRYAVLTSGSTGKPKTVAVGPASLANLVRWYHDLSGLGPGDRMSLLMAVPFDPHLGDLWAGLGFGAALAIAPDVVRYSTDELVDWYRRARVTLSVLPTPMAEPLLSRAWPADLPLRDLLIGGDRLRTWPRPDVTTRIHNVYGPAETTVNVTASTLEPSTGRRNPPIGTPIPGVTACVADERQRIVPRGEAGELLVGGACLALGYLDEDLTRRRFVPGPQGSGLDRVYRTGDQVRMTPDGVLEFLGRLDDQVKIRGVRIELAEVERALERDPSVARAVVVARRTEDGTATLVAFLLGADGQRPDVGAVLAGARAALPEQAVPGLVHVVEDFPLNANGKVDRAGLLAAVPAVETRELSGETAVRLAALLAELLEADGVHADSNFFELGGNSMDAFALVSSIETEFGVTLSMRTVMSLPVLRELATTIDQERARTQELNREHAMVTDW